MADSTLGPGFRFHPTDEELVLYYLKRRVAGKPLRFDPIALIDVYKSEPWDLPGYSKLSTKDLEWYFFSSLETKYGNGWRTNRATQQGYWKTTGKDRTVKHGERIVGMKKTLVFHIGRAPKGDRTNWVMHEYRLVEEELEKLGLKQAAFVLCRVFEKSGSGPKNGEQYGAPFVEEEWEEYDVLELKREENDEDHKYLQYHNVDGQDLATVITPLNGQLLVSHSGSGSNNAEDPMAYFEDDQKIFTGMGENARLLPDEQTLPEPVQKEEQLQVAEQFEMPDQFKMDQAPVQNEFFEVEALLGATDSNYHVDGPVVEGLTYIDAPSNDPPVVSELLVGDPNAVKSDPAEFEMLDEYLKFFDASDDLMNYVDFDSSVVPEVGGTSLNQPAFTDAVNYGNYMVLPGPSNIHAGECSSSSEEKPQIANIMEDVQYDKGWNSTFAKQVSRMLGAIPAPNAYAAEIPMKEAALGKNSGTHSSTSIHVTAGMIHISGTISASRNIWSVGKSGDGAYDMTLGDELTLGNLIINSMEPLSNLMSNKVTSAMVRSGYYFFLFWVMILSVSCKIGSYIYSR